MKIKNADFEFDIEDFHFSIVIITQADVKLDPKSVWDPVQDVYRVLCLAKHKPMNIQLNLESEQLTKEQLETNWKELKEKFVRSALANKHLLAKPISSVKLRV